LKNSENKDRENCADQENLEQRGFCCFGVFFYPLLVFNSYKEYQQNKECKLKEGFDQKFNL